MLNVSIMLIILSKLHILLGITHLLASEHGGIEEDAPVLPVKRRFEGSPLSRVSPPAKRIKLRDDIKSRSPSTPGSDSGSPKSVEALRQKLHMRIEELRRNKSPSTPADASPLSPRSVPTTPLHDAKRQSPSHKSPPLPKQQQQVLNGYLVL